MSERRQLSMLFLLATLLRMLRVFSAIDAIVGNALLLRCSSRSCSQNFHCWYMLASLQLLPSDYSSSIWLGDCCRCCMGALSRESVFSCAIFRSKWSRFFWKSYYSSLLRISLRKFTSFCLILLYMHQISSLKRGSSHISIEINGFKTT